MKFAPLAMAITLVFWGVQTKFLGLSVVMAGVAAFVRKIHRTWKPSADQVNKISDTCAVCFAGAIVYFVSSELDTALSNILRFLPIFTFPLIVVQEISAERSIDLQALYLFRKNIPDKTKQIQLNFSLAFIIICLVSAGAVNHRLSPYYPAVTGIMVLVLLFQRAKGSDIRVWSGAVIIAAAMGFFLHTGLHKTQTIMTQRALGRILDDQADPLTGRTALGRVGRLKLSNRIVFRVILPENRDNTTWLLKEAAYNFFSNNLWSSVQNKFTPVPILENENFALSPNPGLDQPDTGSVYPGSPPKTNGQEVSPKTGLTIMSRIKRNKGILKATENALFINCPAIKSVTANGLGTFCVEGAPGFISYDVVSGDPGPFLLQPGKMDLYIPDRERQLFTDLAARLHLASDTPERLVFSRIKKYFQTNFTYSLELDDVDEKAPIKGFMTRTRTGHCEYFATATVLLLRAAGIPARYVTGFLAFEKGFLKDQIVVRRKHAHAWTQVFFDGRWVFFDTTPPAWTTEEESHFLKTALPDLFAWLEYGFDQLRWGSPETKKKVLWLLVPLAILLVRRLLQKDETRTKKRGRQMPHHDLLTPAASGFHIRRLAKALSLEGFEKEPHETYERFFSRIEDQAFSRDEKEAVHAIIQIHKQIRFGPDPVCSRDQDALEACVDRLIQSRSKR